MAVEDIITRLEFCKSSGNRKWIARCPAHDDKSPSLSIRELNDGRVLINCHAGCDYLSVITAIGLQPSDLFPPDDVAHYRGERRKREQSVDELIVAIAEADRKAGKYLSPVDREREAAAWARLNLKKGGSF